MTQRDAVICAAVRTPVGVGKPVKGALSGIHATDLASLALEAIIDRTGIDPAIVDDVYWGCVSQTGEQGFNMGRHAVLAAGFPESVPATTIDRQCGSSQQALSFAAAVVMSGQADVIIAGGSESMSRIPMGSNMAGGDGPYSPKMSARYENHIFNQGVGAEMIAEKWGLTREYLDGLAVTSHDRAAVATAAGLFRDEIVAVGDFVDDQGIRPGSNVDKLGTLPTPFRENGVVSAGNASQISDGAAALLVTTREKAAELGLKPLVRVHTAVAVGSDPVMMLTGPIAATSKALEKSGLDLEDIGTFEVNEAFAAVIGAWLADVGADPELVNPVGGAIALGHPLGGSGARLATTMIHHMVRNNIRYGLQTMCEGGGMANATILELV